MWKLLGTVVSGFLLLRDIFGYMLPGALFLGIAGSSVWLRSPDQLSWLLHHHSELAPFGFFVALLLLLSYLLGQILVAIGYAAIDFVDWIKKPRGESKKPQSEGGKAQGEGEKAQGEGEKKAAPSMAEELYYSYLYPAMFTEANRRGTINILRIGVSISLVAGACLLYSQLRVASAIALLVGIYMLHNSRTGMAHVAGVRAETIEAAKRAVQNRIPPFNWNAGAGTGESEEASEQKAESRAAAQKAGKS